MEWSMDVVMYYIVHRDLRDAVYMDMDLTE